MNFDELIDAYLADHRIERLCAYLERGPKFADCPIEALNEA